jgi:hypothetical protein
MLTPFDMDSVIGNFVLLCLHKKVTIKKILKMVAYRSPDGLPRFARNDEWQE